MLRQAFDPGNLSKLCLQVRDEQPILSDEARSTLLPFVTSYVCETELCYYCHDDHVPFSVDDRKGTSSRYIINDSAIFRAEKHIKLTNSFRYFDIFFHIINFYNNIEMFVNT